MSKLNVSIQGIRGGNFRATNNIGCVIAKIEDWPEDKTITIDAFEGSGSSYKRRENHIIVIKHEGVEWKGTFDELLNKLK